MKTNLQSKIKLSVLFFLFILNVSQLRAQTDTIPPVITLNGVDTVWIELGSQYTDVGATAFDDTEGDITSNLIMTSDLDVNIPGIYKIEYNASDKSGNKGKPAIRIVVVLNDRTLPVISVNPGAKGCIELSCNNPPYADPGATAYDNRPPFNLSSSIIVSGYVDTRKIGVYTLTYSVQDVAGNKAITQTRQVCVETTRDHGFQISPISGGFRIWTDQSMEVARRSFKWYIDEQYLSGYDTSYELFYYPTDNLYHQVCMDEFFCDDTSAHKYCQILGDTIMPPISGKIYQDENKNCQYDFSETPTNKIPVKLFDKNDKLVATSYSFNGEYAFYVDYGEYKVETDLDDLPMEIQCAYPGKDTLIEVIQGQAGVQDINFPLVCKSGYDIGVINRPWRTFAIPGQKFHVNPRIGDLFSVFENECNSNLSGQIKISVNGKASFLKKETNSLSPDSIIGNNFTYLIDNFSTLKKDAIGLIFETDTLAIMGDTIKVRISVSPDTNDINPDNNHILHHYIVRSSYDPNMKEVYPIDVEPGYSDWMTYTVHFQNTGNAPAFKVRITDTLDEHLDPSSFEVLGYSHTSQVSLRGRSLVFHFPDIMLPDSHSNEKQSHGYFQYRVKPFKNLAEGTKIYNTAYIFFDYNKPIVTNTTVNSFVKPDVMNIKSAKTSETFDLYPNPGSGLFTIAYNESIGPNAKIEIYNLYGALVYSIPYSQDLKLDIRGFDNGFYICKLNTGSAELYRTFIKQ